MSLGENWDVLGNSNNKESSCILSQSRQPDAMARLYIINTAGGEYGYGIGMSYSLKFEFPFVSAIPIYSWHNDALL